MATTLPASWYTDPAIFEAERRAVFGRSWLQVAHVGQLRHRGDYVAATVAGWPVVVVRGDDGALRAFHNVCRHRAGPLVWDGTGSCRAALVCRYHGWSYALDGELRRARDFGDDPGLDPATNGLLAVAVATWRSLVFVHLRPDEAPPLEEELGGFATAFAAVDLEAMEPAGEARHPVAANWKTYADNYLEGYHVPLVHPELNREIDARSYRIDVYDDGWCRHTAPARDGAPTAGLWVWRWPNLAVNVYPDGMNVERFEPRGAHGVDVVYQYFFRPGADLDQRVKESMRLSAELLEEDRLVCEAVQRNLAAGVYETGRLSPRHERAVAWFQDRVRRAVETAPA